MTEAAWAAAFNEDGTDESNLQGAIVKKLIEAAKATGEETLLIPSRGTKPSAGKEWRTLVSEAQLTPLETRAFSIWLEDRWGTEAHDVFREPMKEVALSQPMPKAPAKVDPPAPEESEEKDEALKMFAERATPAKAPGAHDARFGFTGKHVSTKSREQMDIDAHAGVNDSLELAKLTWVLFFGRMPEEGHDSVKYGTHPEGTKLAKTLNSAPGTNLRSLVEKKTTTMADYRDFFRTAHQALGSSPPLQMRLSDHWQELQRFVYSPDMVAAYYKKALPSMNGRGIPDLFDHSILLQVVCEKVNGPANESFAELEAKVVAFEKKMEAVSTKVDKQSEAAEKANAMKGELSNLKNEVSNVKSTVAELKKKPTTPAGDKYCAWCDNNGFAASAYTHNEDKCGRKKAANQT